MFERLKLSVQRQILAEFPSQNNFIASHSHQTICYSPGTAVFEWSHYEVCLQMHHEKSRIFFCSFVAISAFILSINHRRYRHYSILKFFCQQVSQKQCVDLSQTYANIKRFEINQSLNQSREL